LVLFGYFRIFGKKKKGLLFLELGQD